MAKTWKFTVRLLREGITVAKSLKNGHGLTQSKWTHCKGAKLYAGTAYSSKAKWIELLQDGAQGITKLTNRGAVALLFLPIKKRILVVTFGMAHIYLTPESYEQDFGLKVVLNSVGSNGLKSLDVSTPEDQTLQRRLQTSKQSDLSAFGIDIDRDILKQMTGKPSDDDFASEVSGADSLSIRAKVAGKNIHKKCTEILEFYGKKDYEKNFKWVDHIRAVKDASKIKALDALLWKDIQYAVQKKCLPATHLAAPVVLEQADFGSIRYSGFGRSDSYDALDVSDFIAELLGKSESVDIDAFKKNYWVMQSAQHDDSYFKKWKVYECCVFETKHDGHIYVLSAGKWYRVDADYAKEIEGSFKSIPVCGLKFPDVLSGENEGDYNKRLSSTIADAVCLDLTTLRCEGASSGIEPCDVFTKAGEFIHVKNEATSSKLSHLFQQGVVSAEAFVRDKKYRKELKSAIGNLDGGIAQTLSDVRMRPNTPDFKIVYAVMRKPYRNGEMGLPFFSKVVLNNAVRRLEDLGFSVEFAWAKKTS